MIKPFLAAAVALVALPVLAQAQEINAQPGFYIGAGGGMVIPLSNNITAGVGWMAGGTVGYDFVCSRVALDIGYGQLPLNFASPGTALNSKAGQLTGLVNQL